MDVIVLKFKNGEEILARKMSVTNTSVTIAQPLRAMPVQMMGPNGPETRLQLTPWLAAGQDVEKFEISLEDLLFMPIQADDDIAKGYIQNTTNLELA